MSKTDKDGYLSIDQILSKANNNTKTFIAQLEQEEAGERIETVDAIRNRILAEKNNTDRSKKKFISEIKSGLGNEIKTTTGVVFKDKKFSFRIKKFFIKLFARF